MFDIYSRFDQRQEGKNATMNVEDYSIDPAAGFNPPLQTSAQPTGQDEDHWPANPWQAQAAELSVLVDTSSQRSLASLESATKRACSQAASSS